MTPDSLIQSLATWSVTPRSAVVRWGFALVAVSAGITARFLLDDWLPLGFPYVTLFPAVILTAFISGVVAGAVSAVVCGIAAWYFFIAPFESFLLTGASTLALGLYVFIVVTDIFLIHVMNRALIRLAAEQELTHRLARSRELMFQELQHRVSNNLGVVASLLSLQKRKVRDATAVAALEDAAGRVAMVSRMQRMLHDPENQNVAFDAFLRSMADDLVAASGLQDRVRVDVAADPVEVTAEQSVPLALIATEFLANALEHGVEGGVVEVRLRPLADGRAELAISDHGPGLPEGFDLSATTSLGLSIARQFAAQLDAELRLEGKGGTTSTLIFPIRAE